VSYIDCEDIAACAAVLLPSQRGTGETFVVTGPEALTQDQIATMTVRDLTGRPPRTFDGFLATNLDALRSAFAPLG
jgi:nucleoside-diphosphate-sugar epimerase